MYVFSRSEPVIVEPVDVLFVLMNEQEMWERTTISGPLFHFQTSPLPTFRPNLGPPPPKRKLDNYIVKAIVYDAWLLACGAVNIHCAVITVDSNGVNTVQSTSVFRPSSLSLLSFSPSFSDLVQKF